MTRITSTNTEYFREKNLQVCLELLSKDGSDKSVKTILLVGASAKELISIRILALRMGLENYQFVGVNNNPDQVNHFFEYQSGTRFDGWATMELAKELGFQEEDLLSGYLREEYYPTLDCNTVRFNDVCFKNVAMVEGDIIEGLFNDGVRFDAVVCNNLLIHFSENELELSLKSILSLLDGYFVRDMGTIGYVTDRSYYRDKHVQDGINKFAPQLIKLKGPVNMYYYNNPVVGENRLK